MLVLCVQGYRTISHWTVTDLSGVTSRFSCCVTHLSGVTSRFNGCVGGGFASTGFSMMSGSPSAFSSNLFDLLTTWKTHRNAYQRYFTPHLICRSRPRWWCRLHSRCSESDLYPEKRPRSHPKLWSKYHPKNWSRSNFLLKNMSPGNVYVCGAFVFFTDVILHTNIC